MKLRNKILSFLFVMLSCFSCLTDAKLEVTEVEAREFINTLGKEAFSALTDTSSPKTIREEKFQSILSRGFDIKTMARFSLGRYWRSFDKGQRARYVSAFEEMIIKSYVGKFSDFSDATFKISKVLMTKNGGAMVTTLVMCPGKEQFNLVWKAYKTKKGIRIVDVIVDGVSMSITQRSEFASIMQGLNNDAEKFITRISSIGN